MRLDEVMLANIEDAKAKYEIKPGGVTDRAINQMLIEYKPEVVLIKIIEKYEGTDSDAYEEATNMALTLVEDSKRMPFEMLKAKWKKLWATQ